MKELEAVNELAEAMTLGQGVDAVVETALKKVITMFNMDFGMIYLYDKESAGLKLTAQQGFMSPELKSVFNAIDPAREPMSSLLESGHAMAIEYIQTPSNVLPGNITRKLAGDGFISWACAPLKMEGEVIGIYHLGKRSKRLFTARDLSMLEILGNIIGSSLSNAQLLKDLRYKEAELRRALHRAVELQEDERKRLVRELHDEVGQALTSILIRLKTIQEVNNLETIKERIGDLRSLTAQTIEELRRLSMDLRPSALDNLGLVPALRWYIQQSAERSGLEITFLGPEKNDRLSPETELTLYRIAQEGLTNAIRHGKAHKVVVFIERDLSLNVVRLTISDDGMGFNAASLNRGLGLVGIRERVELLNGFFNIETTPGAGTQLWIEIPIKK
jgi:signal transduction histidine kinase